MLIKVVLDTNVWISALRNPGTPRKIVEGFKENLFLLYCAEELLAELITVLDRPKFAGKIIKAEADDLVDFIRETATFIEIQHKPTISRDLKDNMFLACVANAHCDFLVTGDGKHLLVLGQYKNTKIVSPAQFLHILNQQKLDHL